MLFLTTIISCNEDEGGSDSIVSPDFSGTNTILPLGDSRVEGARPEYESYRYELWKNLVRDNKTFDFVGGRADDSNYSAFQGKTFDTDHQGTGGATSSDILNELDAVLANGAPNYVLLGIGGNDLLDNVAVSNIVSNINQIIDKFQAKNPNITILLEQIAPGRSDIMTAELTNIFNQFNEEIPNIANQQTNNTSSVIAINMATGWSDSYMPDDVHYNEAGAKVIADKYYAVLSNIIE